MAMGAPPGSDEDERIAGGMSMPSPFRKLVFEGGGQTSTRPGAPPYQSYLALAESHPAL